VKVTGKSPDTSRPFHGKSAPKHQDQHQSEHQHQISDDDDAHTAHRNFDDDGGASQAEEEPETRTSPAARAALNALALDWVREMPAHWIGPEAFIASLDDTGLITLLTWLYHFRLANRQNRYSLDAPDYGADWHNIINPAGRIIAQTRMGNLAPLEPDDLEDLKQLVNETISSVDPDAILFGE
jgi:hypothetical protein